MKKPLIAYILRNRSISDMTGWKDLLETKGYEVIIGNSLNDIPEDRIKDLDLLIAHLHKEHETSLAFQKGLREFHHAKFKFVAAIGVDEWCTNHSLDDFGKSGNGYYLNINADIVDAVKWFLEN